MDRTPRILLVDDDEGCVRAVSRLLARSGMGVYAVGSVANALEALSREAYDCVITEVMLPDGSSMSLLEYLRDHYPDTGRVILTGAMDYVAIQDAINRGGVHAFYAKPWEAAELIRGVQGVIERCRLSIENRLLLKRLEDRNAELERLVTERTAQLEKAKRELEAIFDAADEPVAVVSAEHEVIRANRAYARAAGLDMRSVPGRKCYEVLLCRDSPCPTCPIKVGLDSPVTVTIVYGERAYKLEMRPFRASREDAYLCHYFEKGVE